MTSEKLDELKELAIEFYRSDPTLPEYECILNKFNSEFTAEVILDLIESLEDARLEAGYIATRED